MPPLLLFLIPVIAALAALLGWQRRQARLTLAASEARYRALAQSGAAGVWHVSTDGRTLYANPAMCRLLEVEGPEELAGHHYHEFYSPESVAQVMAEYDKRVQGISSTYEVQIVGRRGTRRTVILSGSPVFGPDGKMASLIGTLIDVTERRRLARVNTATYRISEAVHSVPTLQELFGAIHRIVGELMTAA
ncbi:MAG: PAS domain-containing protein, partial [Gemmatimonadales bacterium]